MRVLLFGRLGDVAGWHQTDVNPAATLSELTCNLANIWPSLGEALTGPGVQVAVDRTVVRGDVRLAPEAEVAFMPPMSGG